jgi:trehalose synthase
MIDVAATADIWWKNAIIYCLDVQTFADSDGDGIGDFRGLTQHVDDLVGLGVTCIWLMPFYPTADQDDGYDVTDHYAIDPRLGTFGDFTEFMAVARSRGIRVIADLVVNHTSDQHAWFRGSRQGRESRHRDWYVWQDEIPDDGPEGVVFPGEQTGVWTFDTESGQYYLHRFHHHQPDLNIANPAVRDEIAKVIGFWLAQGLSGFRVDAVPFLLELDGIEGEVPGTDPHRYLRDLRAFLQRRNGDAILLGEVNLPFEEQRRFFGDEDGDELNMLFDFVGMQASFLALARGDARPIARTLRQRPEAPDDAAFASFLRNHDELTLDKLTARERNEVFAAFGPQPDMQLYGRGLRRRLPTMLGGDQQWLRMAYSLMFAMPGAPTLFYGEEIGMGENLEIDGRLAVRTPMQWTSGPAAGFTTAPASAACRPFPDGDYGPDKINVDAQRTDPDSLLNWFERLIRLRKSMPEIGWGRFEVVDVDDHGVLVLVYRWGDQTAVTVHNLAGRAARVTVPLGIESATLRDRLGSSRPIAVKGGTAPIKIAAHGYHWFSVEVPS